MKDLVVADGSVALSKPFSNQMKANYSILRVLFIYQFKTFVFKCNLFFCVGRGRGNGGKVKTHSDHGFIIHYTSQFVSLFFSL